MKAALNLEGLPDSILANFMPKGDERKVSDLDIYEREWLERHAAVQLRGPYHLPSRRDFSTDGTPTAERLIHADGNNETGGDERTGRVYRFKDSAVERTYANLIAKETSEDKKSDLRAELLALERYFVAYSEGGLNGNMPSVDWAASGGGNPAGRDHTAKTDYAMDKRDEYRGATLALSTGPLSKHQDIVVKIVVLAGQSPEQAGYAIGRKSRRRASEAAVNVLRSAGEALSTYYSSQRR